MADSGREKAWLTLCTELQYSAEIKTSGWELLQKLHSTQDKLGELGIQANPVLIYVVHRVSTLVFVHAGRDSGSCIPRKQQGQASAWHLYHFPRRTPLHAHESMQRQPAVCFEAFTDTFVFSCRCFSIMCSSSTPGSDQALNCMKSSQLSELS